MAQFMSGDMGSMLGRLGKAWGWFLAFGAVSLVAGLSVIFWPGSALLAIAVLFGAYLVVNGIFRFVGAFAVAVESGWLRALNAILAVLSFIVGLYLLRHPAFSLLILALVLGIYWTIFGVIELFAGIGHPELPGRGWVIASGILSIIVGAIVFFYPDISLLALTLVLGFWLIVYGVILVISSIRLRAATRGVERRVGRLSPS